MLKGLSNFKSYSQNYLMNFPSRSVAVIMAAAATLTAAPQQAKAELPQASQDVLQAIQFLHNACNENIAIKKVIKMKALAVAPASLKAKCAYVDVAQVTSKCIVANGGGTFDEAAKNSANCVYLHGHQVMSNTANLVNSAAKAAESSSTVKTVSKTAEQQYNAAKKDYNSAKSVVKSAGNAIDKAANSVASWF